MTKKIVNPHTGKPEGSGDDPVLKKILNTFKVIYIEIAEMKDRIKALEEHISGKDSESK